MLQLPANLSKLEKTRGRNKIGKRIKKKHQNILTRERMLRREAVEEQRRLMQQERGSKEGHRRWGFRNFQKKTPAVKRSILL